MLPGKQKCIQSVNVDVVPTIRREACSCPEQRGFAAGFGLPERFHAEQKSKGVSKHSDNQLCVGRSMDSPSTGFNQMKTKRKRTPGRSVHDSEIEALGLMSSKSQIENSLREIAGRYGKVLSVSVVQKPMHSEVERDVFFIAFDKTIEALVASQAFDGLLYGFTTLAVSVPRSNKK